MIARQRFQKRQPPRFTDVSFKDVALLKHFVGETGRVLPRSATGASAKQQRMLAQAAKQARQLGLLPFVRKEGR